jgi:thioesterase domain-containing protein
LGGASFGGAVAFEMSRQLQAEGQRIEVLALFDTPCGEQLGERPEGDAAILAHIAGQNLVEAPLDWERLDPEEQITAFIREMRARRLMPEVEDAQARNLVRVWRANTDALFHYAPGPYAGRVVFFRARERSPGHPRYPELPWVDAAAGGAEVHVVPGDHEGILVSPNVETLAARLRDVIAAAAQAAPEGGGGPPAHDAGLPRRAAPLAH